MSTRFEVLGVGAPLVDYLLRVEETFIHSLQGEKWGMELVDYATSIRIIESSGSIPTRKTGGSAANVIKGLAALGHSCAFTGKVGEDGLGEEVWEEVQELGITPYFYFSPTPTGRAICLITPDGKRTCRTFLGASHELHANDLKPKLFRGTKLVHIEGYTLLVDSGVTERAMALAKEAGAAVSLDLGSFEVVKCHRERLAKLIGDFVDILFANSDEAHAFTGEAPEAACRTLQTYSSIATVMMAEKGCWTGSCGEVTHCPAFPVRPIDTTGAGDIFASGFLHGWLSKKPLTTCARWGALSARAVVQTIGAEISADEWREISRQIR